MDCAPAAIYSSVDGGCGCYSNYVVTLRLDNYGMPALDE